MPSDAIASATSSNTVVGIRSDLYERHLEFIWMTKDDIETFESRMLDKIAFENIAIALVTGAAPLGIDKVVTYLGNHQATDLAIVIVCIVIIIIGIVFHIFAVSRNKKIEAFKDRLFKSERLISRTFAIVETSTANPTTNIVSASK